MKAIRIFVLIASLAVATNLSAQTVSPAFSSANSTAPVKDSATAQTLPASAQVKLSLLGGTIESVNPVTNELLLKAFGGGHMKVLFDERTLIYLDRSAVGHPRDLRHGQRIHLDTALEGNRVFAQNIYLLGQLPTVESHGQVESYQASGAELVMRDAALGTSVRVHILPGTVVNRNDRIISPLDIKPGSLIAVAFQPAGNGRVNASKISVVAQIGDTFTFAGQVAHLDMRSHLVVLETGSDHRTYEIYFDSARGPDAGVLHEGRDVTVTATFDGTRYVGNSLTITP